MTLKPSEVATSPALCKSLVISSTLIKFSCRSHMQANVCYLGNCWSHSSPLLFTKEAWHVLGAYYLQYSGLRWEILKYYQGCCLFWSSEWRVCCWFTLLYNYLALILAFVVCAQVLLLWFYKIWNWRATWSLENYGCISLKLTQVMLLAWNFILSSCCRNYSVALFYIL